tara:strand:- start:17364 stop:17627 length:264 start_codon:yes stop_codon:yes gene_type:complete
MQTYVLSLVNQPEGVFSLVDSDTGDRIIPIFEDQSDAERYALQLIESRSGPTLQIIEIEKEIIVAACEEKSHKYAIITIDDFIIPPI